MEAVERMKQHFPKPDKAPREAWFMDPTNQRYFSKLVEVPIDQLEIGYLTEYFLDTGAGIKNFGRFEEWVTWFQYLLPYTLIHIHSGDFLKVWETDLPTLLIDYFLNLYPDGIIEEYPGFRDDVLGTLPQCLMEIQLWNAGDLVKQFPLYHERQDSWWSSWLNGAMFFCLKYLTIEEISTWVASIAAIEGQVWRQLITQWLTGASKLFDYFAHPEVQPNIEELKRRFNSDGLEAYLKAAKINWEDSYLVFLGLYSKKALSDYLSQENIDFFWTEVNKYPQLSFTDATMN